MIRRLLIVVATVVASIATAVTAQAAGAIVTIDTPAGIYAPVDIATDSAADVTWNPQAVDGSYVAEGDCTPITIGTVGPHRNPTHVGYHCTGPAHIHLTTTGQLTSTCPYDGATLEVLHLTIKVDGAVVYDKQLWLNPTICYVTPQPAAAPAITTWDPEFGVLTFDNTAQAAPSAPTTFYVNGPEWLYDTHTFDTPDGVTCTYNLKRIYGRTRFQWRTVHDGFHCTATVPAGQIATVTVT